jgi:hypothetical protein
MSPTAPVSEGCLVKRILVTLLLAALLGSTTSTLPVGRSAASPVPDAPVAERRGGPDKVVSRRYSSYRMADVPGFNMCAGVYVTAQMKADVYFTPIEGGAYVDMVNPRIVNPSMLVTLKKSCDDSAEVKRRHAANQVSYNYFYYGYKCSYDPSFTVAIPWSIGVGITPDCGDERVARHGDRHKRARRAYRFELDTDGMAFRWSQKKTHTQPTTLTMCTSVASYLVFKDTEGAVRRKVQKKVGFSDACVTYKYPG